MKVTLFLLLLLLSSACFSQEPIFQQVEISQLRFRDKDLLKIMPPYDSLFIETNTVLGNPHTTIIHFYKGQVSVGHYYDAISFLALAAQKKLCRIDSSIVQYYDMFADTILMEPISKALADTIVFRLSSIVQLTNDPDFSHCNLYAPKPQDGATITLQKVLSANTTINECSFYALDKMPGYCPGNVKCQQVASIPTLFKKAYESIADIIQRKRTDFVLKRFAMLGKFPKP